jgi:hypothetical protein
VIQRPVAGSTRVTLDSFDSQLSFVFDVVL